METQQKIPSAVRCLHSANGKKGHLWSSRKQTHFHKRTKQMCTYVHVNGDEQREQTHARTPTQRQKRHKRLAGAHAALSRRRTFLPRTVGSSKSDIQRDPRQAKPKNTIDQAAFNADAQTSAHAHVLPEAAAAPCLSLDKKAFFFNMRLSERRWLSH